MDVRVKTIPKRFEAGKQLIIEWDIGYNLIERNKTSYLYFHANGKNIEIGNSDTLVNYNYSTLIGNRANVSITYNKIIVTFEKLEQAKFFKFTVLAIAGEYGQKPFTSKKSITINTISGMIKINTKCLCTAGFNFEFTVIQH